MLKRSNTDETLAAFLQHLCYALLLAFVIIAALARLGFPTASVIAVLGAAGLAVGFALHGSLANFAAGVMLLIFKPFKVGDFIEAAGTMGIVQEIHIFHTILNTPDNIRTIIANNHVTGGNIKNYTVNGTRRIEIVVGVSYDDDLTRARQVIEQVIAGDERILPDPAPKVAVKELGESSVDFVVRPWVNVPDFWDVCFDLTEKIKVSLDQNGITIPFPQRDIHIKDGQAQSTAG